MELPISRVKEKESWSYLRRMRAAENMACIEAIRNANKILVGRLNVSFILQEPHNTDVSRKTDYSESSFFAILFSLTWTVIQELLKIRHGRFHHLTADSSVIQSSKGTEESIWIWKPNKKHLRPHNSTEISFWLNNYQLLWGTLKAT